MKNKESFAPFLQNFFVRYLPLERGFSRHTIQSYRDTFTMFFRFVGEKENKLPHQVKISDVDSFTVILFLDFMEKKNGITARTRNQRLAAIKSFYKYLILHRIELSNQIQQILCIPSKKQNKKYIDYLTAEEETALLKELRTDSRRGLRDYLLIKIMLGTGARVSEVASLRKGNIFSTNGYNMIRILGKGRKSRQIPINEDLADKLQRWCYQIDDNDSIFLSIHGKPITNNGVQYILDKYVKKAAIPCPSLSAKRVSNHVLRHTAAMRLLESGVAVEVIALWLGHEKVDTALIYLQSNVEIKKRILDKNILANEIYPKELYKPDDELLEFLKNL